MKVIKGVLEEELESSLRQEAAYRKALDKMLPGSLVKKKIGSGEYYYLVFRENGKVRFSYLGKLSKSEAKKIGESIKLRRKYKALLSQSKKQVAFLRKALHAKEIRTAS